MALFYIIPIFVSAEGLVPCGSSTSTESVCTLCHLFQGILNIIGWGFTILTSIAFVILVIAGIMYIVSAGNTGMIDMAKSALKNTLIGFALVLLAWVIVNTVFLLLPLNGSLKEWGKISCSLVSPYPTPPGSGPGDGTGDGPGDGEGSLLVCGGLSTLMAGSTMQLKAWYSANTSIASCTNTTGASDVTGTATWTSSDSTVMTVAKGEVTAASTITEEKSVTATAAINAKSGTKTFSVTPKSNKDTVSFKESVYSVNVKDKKVRITLKRIPPEGGATASIAAHYILVPGTAKASVNYTDKTETITWASGDVADKTVEIEIKDSGATSDQTFQIKIDTVTPTDTLLSNNPATITILSALPCELIAGNKDAKVAIIMVRSNSKIGTLACSPTAHTSWKDPQDNLEKFKTASQQNATEMGTLLGSRMSNFAVYRSDEIDLKNDLKSPSLCPSEQVGKKEVYAFYVLKGDVKAWTPLGSHQAFGCLFNATSEPFYLGLESRQTTLSHETIGHGFTFLMDEYTYKTPYPWPSPSYNCTTNTSCTKWQADGLVEKCSAGCEDSKNFRSSEKNIMESDANFSKLHLLILDAYIAKVNTGAVLPSNIVNMGNQH